VTPHADTGFDFGPLADSYDSWYATATGRMYDLLEKKAMERFLPDPAGGDRLLEVGCGTGHWTAFFSRRGFSVTGVDISPDMVRVARGKRIPGVRLQVADAHRLPFADGRFDVTAAVAVLEFVRDPQAVLREMARCTRRPGGVILVGVLNALASVNRRRQAAGRPPYHAARLFSPREIREALAPYGRPRVLSAAFVPEAPALLWIAPVADAIGRTLRLPTGAFLVGRVDL